MDAIARSLRFTVPLALLTLGALALAGCRRRLTTRGVGMLLRLQGTLIDKLPRLPRGATYCGILLAALCFSPRADASFILNFTEVGSDVVANGSGMIDLSALTSKGACGFNAGVLPASGSAIAGNTGNLGLCDVYSGFSGPSNFGAGGFTAASAATGDTVGIEDILPGIFVPSGYVSGASLSDTATWSNQTFSSLGMTPGTYTWTWGTGGTADSFVVQIGASSTSAPEPNSIFLLGTGAILIALSRSKNRLPDVARKLDLQIAIGGQFNDGNGNAAHLSFASGADTRCLDPGAVSGRHHHI